MNCPACRKPIPPKHVHFCPECWMMVPAKIRVEVYQMTARKQDLKTKIEQAVRAVQKARGRVFVVDAKIKGHIDSVLAKDHREKYGVTT